MSEPSKGHNYAKTELSDAHGAIDESNYTGAALFVHNARAEIQNYGIDYGPITDRFDGVYDDYMREVAKSGANKTFLMDYETYPEHIQEEEIDDGLLHDKLDHLESLEKQMSNLNGKWSQYFDPRNPERTSLDEFEAENLNLNDLVCIRCGEDMGLKIGSSLSDLPGDAGLCRKCLFHLIVLKHEEPVV
ncbi:hypothetical protein [Haloarcula sp. CGMCC 1.2071]|uniref:hypothetical protein n=1 Tax=Haloarcula sp. CGMCC 1.2071 TaxID=3111454 RepID=UPI00300EBA8C